MTKLSVIHWCGDKYRFANAVTPRSGLNLARERADQQRPADGRTPGKCFVAQAVFPPCSNEI